MTDGGVIDRHGVESQAAPPVDNRHYAGVRRWELWVGEGTLSFFPEENEPARRMAQEEGFVLCWEVIAKGHNPAERALHEYRGWGEYKPMLNEDGEPFPEDEDDDHVQPMR